MEHGFEKKCGLWKACGFEISMRISKKVHGFEKYLDLIKLHKLGKNTGVWKKYLNVKNHGFEISTRISE